NCLSFPDYCCPIAEREGWGHFGRFWRTRQPGSLWSKRSSHHAHPGDYTFGRSVHAYVSDAFYLRHQTRGAKFGVAGSEIRTSQDAAGHANARSGQSSGEEIIRESVSK